MGNGSLEPSPSIRSTDIDMATEIRHDETRQISKNQVADMVRTRNNKIK